MEILGWIALLAIGFAGMIKGADWFVDGSSSLARKMRVPGIIVGLTIVAMGTSAPELAVSVTAALQGANEIALSNVTGSNSFNLLMVLGITALFAVLPVENKLIRRDYPYNLGSTLVLLGFLVIPYLTGPEIEEIHMRTEIGSVSRLCGICLLVLFVAYILILIRDAKKNKTEEDEAHTFHAGQCILMILLGIACIVAGGQAVVYSARSLASAFGMSETLIGLTIVAAGTSLPELVTSIVAAKKGETGMAVGNAVGSCIFNTLLILGISSVIHPIAVTFENLTDMLILILVSIIVYLFSIRSRSLERREGICMVLLYAAYMAFAIIR